MLTALRAIPHLVGVDTFSRVGRHPVALFFLFLFRCLAIATYLLCGFFVSSYVFSVSTLPHRPARGLDQLSPRVN